MTQENDAVRDKDQKSEKVPLLFADSEAVEEIARKLIPKHHPHLGTARMKYICRNIAAKRGGRAVPGNVYKMTGKWEYLVGCDFVVEVALEVWNDLEPHQRLALVDHLLTRCMGEESEENGEMKWKIVLPEVQEFAEIAERHGQWHEGLVELEKGLRVK
jgi:hypothetical protein